MSSSLSSGDRSIIAALSRPDVELTTLRLKGFLANRKWIGPRNRYGKRILEHLKADVPLSAAHSRNLAQYIAGTTALHCFDGWSYLGRALGALLSGDPHRSLHLAYYAELRAALALLATEGIGIFHNKHFVIDQPDSTRKLSYGAGTHIAAWTALEFWSSQPSSGLLFAKLIRPEAISLEDWFFPHGGTASLAPQAKSWFMQWGMDLSLAAKDRDARNDSSYQPDGLPAPWSSDAGNIINFVSDLWQLLEPGSGSAFDLIDRHILRIALATQFKARFAKSPSTAKSKYRTYIDDTLRAQGLSPTSYLRDWLLLTGARHSSPIFVLSKKAPTQSLPDVFCIISRAVLLLRVAAGSVSDQLQSATFDRASLQFWWEAVGEARGLWKPGSAPEDLQDLWRDIEDALSDIREARSANPNAFRSIFEANANLGSFRNSLTSTERVALWALCPT